MNWKEIIQKEASLAYADIQSIRQYLHAHPELSFHEDETAKYIAAQLEKLGIPYQEKVGGNGLVALIEGGKPGKVRALRADFDALPIQEENQVPYKSKNDGVMHACGHDVHTSCLLGAAMILNKHKDELGGTVKLIFQHAEEMTPGGAKQMIEAGALENPKVEEITGQHVFPDLEVGKVGFRKGMYMASTDELFITVKGKGGHAALPHKLIDPIYIGAQFVVALQHLISRKRPPHIPSVLSIGRFIGNGSTNVIPDQVEMMGTFRAMDEDWRAEAKKLMRQLAKDMGSSMNAEIELKISDGYPYLVNDDALTERNINIAKAYLGDENVIDLDLRMTGEDFAYYGHTIPACFYRLGTRNEEKGITHGLHTSRFDVDEKALEIGAGLLAFIAVNA